ncbi:uncharacterized protein LOC110849090 [Folsomia candida]|uniref:N-acetyltransferase domain-containing protein n=1 Tax=Folsomia candida TaxID=158441 RepID=A0A226EJ73_FOLCA|nr:uncharacterized protein LOC110849090 [Folsomia candida]OXA56596.1 hypothetical protein Fcan01_08731 [Folsomia candida]
MEFIICNLNCTTIQNLGFMISTHHSLGLTSINKMSTPANNNESDSNFNSKIRTRHIISDDISKVVSHLSSYFCRDEFTLGLWPSDDVLVDLEWILEKIISHGLCALAEDIETLEIVGVLCCYIQTMDEEILPFSKLKRYAMKINFGLNTVAVKNSNFWEVINESQYLHVFAFSVHPDWRNAGVGTRLAKDAFFSDEIQTGPHILASMFTSPHENRERARIQGNARISCEIRYAVMGRKISV